VKVVILFQGETKNNKTKVNPFQYFALRQTPRVVIVSEKEKGGSTGQKVHLEETTTDYMGR
jgi:hypothetical protein